MRTITHEIGTKVLDGKLCKVVRNYFVYDSVNWMKEAQSEFTKHEKKIAKLNHKKNLKSYEN